MTDSVAGLPYATLGVPGRDLGLQILLDREADGQGVVRVLPYRVDRQGRGRQPDREHLREGRPARWRHQGVAGARPVDRPRRRRGVHAAHRQARPGPGPRVDRLRAAHRRDHDLVLPAAPPGLDPDRARRAAGHRVALGSLRRRRARIRAVARPARRGPPSHLTRPATPSRAIVQHPQPSSPTVDTEPQPGPLLASTRRRATRRSGASRTTRTDIVLRRAMMAPDAVEARHRQGDP